ncbi:MAG: hypothetical protein KDJ44_02155 [Rhodoblastus sp.]|nr:hypothetical protein [Rhodoblastus sp.]
MAIPGKSCGPCTMCCSALEIDHFKKPMGVTCEFCVKGGGCNTYATRPQVCRDFECDWMMERDLPATLRPDKVGTILMEDPDNEDYQAVCEPTKPMAWRHPLVFKHLVAQAKAGRTVIAKSGLRAWRIYPDGHFSEWS